MTITYDAAGLCTRCGSTGYYISSYTSDSSFEDTRTRVEPCPCHGWRPIEWAPKGCDEWVDLWRDGILPIEARWFFDHWRAVGGARLDPPTFAFTYFRHCPQPQEGV